MTTVPWLLNAPAVSLAPEGIIRAQPTKLIAGPRNAMPCVRAFLWSAPFYGDAVALLWA